MKIKVVEALGFGKAVVCTSKAADGIALDHMQSACIADEPELFAKCIVALLENDALRHSIERAALSLHAAQHSPEAAARMLRAIFPCVPGRATSPKHVERQDRSNEDQQDSGAHG